MKKRFDVPEHPVWKMPSLEMARRWAELKGLPEKDAWLELENTRLEKIRMERDNPLQHGWEPPIWRVCDALLGLDWILEAGGWGADYGARMRGVLGFKEPLDVLLINGGNRAGKSEYAAKRLMQCLLARARVTAWCFHTDNDNSVQYQQPLLHKFMPPGLREVDIKSATTYVSYKLKTGFSDGSFILPNLSLCDFRNYRMDKQKIEGGELGDVEKFPVLGCWADELIPGDWAETLLLRLATRNAKMVITFTPVDGYNSTVKLFQEGARTVRSSRGLLCPMDGGKASVHALRMEDCDRWLDGDDAGGLGGLEPGRLFDRVPRVMRSGDDGLGVVFFHSCDNPYGNPEGVRRRVVGKPFTFVKERFYGFAERMNSGKFPLFNEKVHVVRAVDIPPVDELTIYQFVDPCSGRNWFMGWFGVDAAGRKWMLGEWPNRRDFIPGVGVMDRWAHTSGDLTRKDGRMGKGQESLGWGLLQYKKEIARVEGWEAYDVMAESEAVAGWVDAGRARWPVFQRFLDARFANVKSFEDGGMESLFDKMSDVGMEFFESVSDSRDSIRDGVQIINDALCYDPNRPADINNQPTYFISEECENTIFAMGLWTGDDGQKGATKDPVDVQRMFFLKGCEFVDKTRGGGYAGEGCY